MSEEGHRMESKAGQTLRFFSWNVCGLEVKINGRQKLDFVFEELSRQKAQIVFLQETHIGSKNHSMLKDKAKALKWKCFFTVYDSQSKGVAILIKENVPFQYFCHDEDYSGGYLVLFCHLHGELFTLVNVYNHKDDKDVLNRLQDYLREMAEGVLIVGGDFNTVLDLNFDRISAGKNLYHTPLWDPFKKFTTSLNLMDTWAYSKPTVRGFTYSKRNVSSRLDMFLLPEDIIEQVSDLVISKTERIPMSTNNANMRNISDHEPLVLSFTLSEETRKGEMPQVAACLDNTYTYNRDERSGKINGAEILSVIKSLTDSGQQYSDGNKLQDYKKSYCPKTEILKIHFNSWLTGEETSQHFKEHTSSTYKYLNLDYLIFVMVLAKRLKMLLVAVPEEKNRINEEPCYSLAFSEKPIHIKWNFLKECLLFLCKICKSDKLIFPRDFTILDYIINEDEENFCILESILPKSSNSDDSRELQDGCPLTMAILSLVLKYLEIQLKRYKFITYICHYRQILVLCRKNPSKKSPENYKNVQILKQKSGLGITFSKIN